MLVPPVNGWSNPTLLGRCSSEGPSWSPPLVLCVREAGCPSRGLLLRLGRRFARQATAAQLVAQLQVVTGHPGVYMMYPGPAANGVVMVGAPVGAPLGLGGGSALGGVAPLFGPAAALDPGLGPDLGLGPAGRVAGV